MDLAELIAVVPAYALQSAMLLVAGLLLPGLLHCMKPSARILYYRFVLFIVIFLPLLGLWWTSTHPSVVEPEMMVSFEDITDYVLSGSSTSVSAFPFWSIYGLIALFFISRLISGLIFLKRLRRQALPYEDPGIIQAVQAVFSCKAEFRISDRISGPVTFGWLNPTILVPVDFGSFNESQRKAIVYHEMLHVYRKDWFFGIIDEVIRSVVWFHPAVWILLDRIVLWREKAVDLEVIRLTKQPRIYLEALKNFAQRRRNQIKLPAHTLTIKNHLLQRMKFLIRGAYKSKTHLMAAMPIFTLTVLVVGFFGAMIFPLLPSRAEADDRVKEIRGERISMPSLTVATSSEKKTTKKTTVQRKQKLKTKKPPRKSITSKRARRRSKISLSAPKQPSKHPAKKTITASIKEPVTKPTLPLVAKLQPKAEPETSSTSLDEQMPETVEAEKTETHSMTEPKLLYSVRPVCETVYLGRIGNRVLKGEVVVSVSIDTQGRVTDVKPVRTSDERLNKAVFTAVRKWRFTPAMLDGRPVNAKKLVKIKFVPEYKDEAPITGTLIRRSSRSPSTAD